MARKLWVFQAVSEAFKAWPRQIAGAWGALGLLSLSVGALLLSACLGVYTAYAAPVLGFVTAVLTLVAYGALTRSALSPNLRDARQMGLGFAGLQFGGAELQILFSGLLTGLFAALVIGMFALVLVLIASLLVMAPDDVLGLFRAPEAQVMGLMQAAEAQDLEALQTSGADWRVLVLFVLAAFLGFHTLRILTKLKLGPVASVARGRIVSLNALSLGHHSALPLLFGAVLVSIVPLLLLVGVFQPLLWGALTPLLSVLPLGVAKLQSITALGILIWGLLPLCVGYLSAAYHHLES